MKKRVTALFHEIIRASFMNITLCFVLGSLLGGIELVEGNELVIHPITMISMVITGIILGIITGVLTMRGVASSPMTGDGAEPAAESPGTEPAPGRTNPPNKTGATIALCAFMVVISVAALVLVMVILGLFGISDIHYYWFLLIVILWSMLASRIALKTVMAKFGS